MVDEAYRALEAVKRGNTGDLAGGIRWVDAFKVIGWAVDTAGGPALTSAGREACEEMARKAGSLKV